MEPCRAKSALIWYYFKLYSLKIVFQPVFPVFRINWLRKSGNFSRFRTGLPRRLIWYIMCKKWKSGFSIRFFPFSGSTGSGNPEIFPDSERACQDGQFDILFAKSDFWAPRWSRPSWWGWRRRRGSGRGRDITIESGLAWGSFLCIIYVYIWSFLAARMVQTLPMGLAPPGYIWAEVRPSGRHQTTNTKP